MSTNQARVDAYLADVAAGKARPPYPDPIVMAKPLPSLTPEERKHWDAVVIKNYESPK